MAGKVGAKGNVVIEKSIRDQLGIEAGWETVQVVRDGYVEIYFLPPAFPGMAAGALREYTSRSQFSDEDALHDAIEEAMAEFRRILVPGGWFASIAFGRTETGREENVAIEQVLRNFSPDHKDTHANYIVYRRLEEFLTRDYHYEEILTSTQLDWDGLHGLFMSLSYSPARDDEAYPAFECALREVFDRYQRRGRFVIETRYWINVGRFAEE